MIGGNEWPDLRNLVYREVLGSHKNLLAGRGFLTRDVAEEGDKSLIDS